MQRIEAVDKKREKRGKKGGRAHRPEESGARGGAEVWGADRN